jgi:DNA helicase-2/ATP-dependent DNA helicase PcrA
LQELKLADEIYRQEKDLNAARRRIENQQEVVNAMSAYLERDAQPSLAGFLDKVSLLDDDGSGRNDKEKKLAEDAVTLMSLHSSKGLEFPVVFLVGMEEGFLPHKKSIYETFDISEERRLCYVGITRAENKLVLLGAKQRRKYGKLEQREPSRFLTELPDSILKTASGTVVEAGDEKQQEKSAVSFFSGISDLLGD